MIAQDSHLQIILSLVSRSKQKGQSSFQNISLSPSFSLRSARVQNCIVTLGIMNESYALNIIFHNSLTGIKPTKNNAICLFCIRVEL